MTSVLGTLYDTGQESKDKLSRKSMNALDGELRNKMGIIYKTCLDRITQFQRNIETEAGPMTSTGYKKKSNSYQVSKSICSIFSSVLK